MGVTTPNNRFTAVVGGLYQFSFNTVFDNYSGNVVRVFEFAFVKNGVIYRLSSAPFFPSSRHHPQHD